MRVSTCNTIEARSADNVFDSVHWAGIAMFGAALGAMCLRSSCTNSISRVTQTQIDDMPVCDKKAVKTGHIVHRTASYSMLSLSIPMTSFPFSIACELLIR